MNIDRRTQAILTIFGVSAGVASGLWLWRRRRTVPAGPGPRWGQPRGSAQDVAEALRNDGKLSGRGIEVDAIAEGVVELNGSVADRTEAERAVGIAQRTTGVYTVVNRLVVGSEESQRTETRRRWHDGAPELRERHHYGMGVGMGTRRQSPDTDPDRPSDKQSMLERELDLTRVDEEADAPTREPNATSRVETTDVKPGDERAIEDAGLDPSGESTGEVGEAEREGGTAGPTGG